MLLSFNFLTRGAVFDDESWIAAYHFKKNLTKEEKFLPFIDIREKNYRYSAPGNCIRLIKADCILLQQFPLFQTLSKFEDGSLDLYSLLYTIFSNIALPEDYKSKIEQLAALVVFRNEIVEKFNVLSTTYNGDFNYRFYHLIVAEYETTARMAATVTKNQFTELLLPRAQKYLYGIYDIPLSYINNEVSDSRIATDRINSLMPIYPKNFFNLYHSPFISVNFIPMDPEYKKLVQKRYGSKVPINIAHGAQLVNYTLTRKEIERIYQVIYDFDDTLLMKIKHDFQLKFGFVNTNSITQTNMKNYLHSLFLTL